jgi:hypothetical protein
LDLFDKACFSGGINDACYMIGIHNLDISKLLVVVLVCVCFFLFVDNFSF